MNGYVRSVASILLAGVLSLLLAASSLGVWAERTALNNDVFAQNAQQVLVAPQVQTAISTYVVDEIFLSLPDQATGLSLVGELLRGAIEREVTRVLGLPVVQSELLQALVNTHQQSVALVQSDSDDVVFDLGPVFRAVVQGLVGEKVIPSSVLRNTDRGEVYLYRSDSSAEDKESLEEVQRVVKVVRKGLTFAILLSVVCAAGVIFSASRRLYGIRNVFVSLLLASSLGLVVFSSLKRFVPNQIVDGPNRDAAVEILSVMMHSWNLFYVVCVAASIIGLIFTVRQGLISRLVSSQIRGK